MEILGVLCDNPSFEEALERAAAFLREPEKKEIFFLNIDCLYRATEDAEYRDCVNSASFVLPDGIGLKLAARFSGHRLKANCNGTDFSPELMRHAAEKGYRVFFLGGLEGIAAQAAENMKKKLPSLQIAGTHPGYFDSDEKIADLINRSGAQILLVAMGVPLQEKWIRRNRARLEARLCLGVGALLDFWSGRVPRAPRWVRACRLEWSWRLMIEPRRLFKRYFTDGSWLLGQALRGKFSERSRQP